MSRIFVISDTHFGHEKILQFEARYRPFKTIKDHDDELIRRWNSVVTKRDVVYHLGDVLFGKDSFDYLTKLNGIKKLILGNHDTYAIQEYLRFFTKVFGSFELRGGILTHIPIAEEQSYRYKFNIHGHMHSNFIDKPFYKCVSAEQINLTPICIEDII